MSSFRTIGASTEITSQPKPVVRRNSVSCLNPRRATKNVVLKRAKLMAKTVRKRMRATPEPGVPAPPTEQSPRILSLTAFTIHFSRSEDHLSNFIRILRSDSISARVRYGLRPNLSRNEKLCKFIGYFRLCAFFFCLKKGEQRND